MKKISLYYIQNSGIYRKILLLPLLCLLVFISCSDEDQQDNVPAGKDQQVIFMLSAQGGDVSPSTYAMSAADEQKINTVDVLSFLDDGSGDYYYSYKAHTFNITASLRPHSQQQKFVVLINANTELTAAGISNTDKLEDVLPKLVSNSANEWDKTYTPMCGYVPAMQITETTSTINLKMIRTLARIDIRTSNGLNFKLKEAYLFNRPTNGRVTYNDSPVNWDVTNNKVLKPTLASVPAITKTPHKTFQADINGSFVREIYTFEAKAVNDKDDATAIVVGGYYDYPANNTTLSYYRIDIPKYANGVAQSGTMGDILRNYLYDIEIQNVLQEGLDTPQEAFDGVTRIIANIRPWELADINSELEGIYELRVSESSFVVGNSGSSNQQLDIFTDYDQGWQAWLVPSNATSWITFAPAPNASHDPDFSGTTNAWRTLQFSVQNNTTGIPWRHAVLKVRAGKIAKYVDIFQSDLDSGNIPSWDESMTDADYVNYRLGVSRATYSLYRDAQNNIPLVVTTDHPGGYTATVEGGSWINVQTGSTGGAAGTYNITFKVEQNDTGVERNAYVIIKSGKLIKKIKVKQAVMAGTGTEPDITPWGDPGFDNGTDLKGPYNLNVSRDECRYDSDAKSNIEGFKLTATGGDTWTASSSESWLQLQTATGTANGSPVDIRYTMSAYTGSTERTATVTININKLTKQVKITQYAGKGITVSNVLAEYEYKPDMSNEKHKFTLRTKSAWSATVTTGASTIRQLHTPSDVANWSTGIDFLFTLSEFTGTSNATIRITSTTNEFNPTDIQIQAAQAYYLLGGLHVRIQDQPAGYSWYEYSNTPYGTNEYSEPPTTGMQVNPAQQYSCASIASSTGKPWRLPTYAELQNIYAAATTGGAATRYGFNITVGNNCVYWSATTTPAGSTSGSTGASCVYFAGGNQATGVKTTPAYPARCVRDK